MPTLTEGLEASLELTLNLAAERNHEFATLEHLLLGILSDPDAVSAVEACLGNVADLKKKTLRYIDEELDSLITTEGGEVVPTAALQRVVQRAILHVESSGREHVSSVNVLLSLFSERDSYATFLLSEQDLTRYDVLNFISNGIRKTLEPKSLDMMELTSSADLKAGIAIRYLELQSERAIEAERQLSEAVDRIAALEQANEALRQQIVSQKEKRPDIFVSYQRADRESVAPLIAALRAEKFDVWWDADIQPGEPWEQTIEKYITQSAVVFVCWSAKAVLSENVKSEARFGRDRDKLIQIFLDSTPPPLFFGERQGLVFEEWDGSAGHKCFRDLVFYVRRKLLDATSSHPLPS